MIEFKGYPKTNRYSNEIVRITEKIDGTNIVLYNENGHTLHVGSRNRWLSAGKQHDNHGAWSLCQLYKEHFLKYLPQNCYCYGEFWGHGIGKRYPKNTPKAITFFSEYLNDIPELLSINFVKKLHVFYKGPPLNIKPNFLTEELDKYVKNINYDPEGFIIEYMLEKIKYKIILN